MDDKRGAKSLIKLMFNTSFKYLDTGVILSLMLLASEPRKGLSKP